MTTNVLNTIGILIPLLLLIGAGIGTYFGYGFGYNKAIRDRLEYEQKKYYPIEKSE